MSFVPENLTTDYSDSADRPQLAARRQGVLLINLGTPQKPDAQSVREYLAEFLSDPAVIKLPGYLRWLNRPLGCLIARLRASKSARMYQRIWTERGSPLSSITEEQTRVLGSILPPGWQVFHAMRYGRPSIAQTLKTIEAAAVERLVVVPMYPQFSGTTTGTALRELYNCLERGGHHLNVSTRASWYDDGGYIHAQARLIAEYARAHNLTPENSYLVFSAHGLPISYVKAGDPYPTHARRSIELIMARLGWPSERMTMGYQSRMGPAKWLEPRLDELLQGLVQSGEKRLLVCPISFTVDCLETLEEIDLRYRELVEAGGGDLFLCPALNEFAPFITALRELVLRGPRPIASTGESLEPLLASPGKKRKVHRETDSLVMIGASMSNRVGEGCGPRLSYSTAKGLHETKKATCEVPALLRDICTSGSFREAFLWNTCFRFEFYGWLPAACDDGERERAIAEAKRRLFAEADSDDLPVNVLVGADAWHHLMRTSVGLNSGLPGDRDVLEQLQTAQRVAERAGTSGRLLSQLISDTIAMERDVRDQTAWGRFDAGYCQAALSRVAEATDVDFAECRIVALGGSTTTRSVLTTLAQRFEVPSRQMTLIYRGHGSGQIKLLRKAIGSGKRLRVGSYGESQIAQAVAEADVVVFGLDSDQPVLDARQIRDLRDFGQRPLTLIDFNTFGSTSGMDALEGVTVWDAKKLDEEVMAFGNAMCASDQFGLAVEDAQRWIVEQTPIRQCRVVRKPTPAVCRDCRRPSGLCVAVAAGRELR